MMSLAMTSNPTRKAARKPVRKPKVNPPLKGPKVRHNCIREGDILLQRGGYYYTYSGNERLRQLVKTHLSRFQVLDEQGSKLGKTRLSKAIVKIIRDNGGRFLRADNYGHWVDVTDHPTIPREKVATLFREFATKDPSPRFAEEPWPIEDDEQLPFGSDDLFEVGAPDVDLFLSNHVHILLALFGSDADEQDDKQVHVASSEDVAGHAPTSR